jgi:hypothetical protein
MVTNRTAGNERGALATECVVALGILAAVMLPLSFSFVQETKVCRAYYHRAVALEIIDGEMEVLVAGEWRSLEKRRRGYPVRGHAATNLPPGEFTVMLGDDVLHLEWTPRARGSGGTVVREVKLK